MKNLLPDKVYEFRCLECGRICWTTLDLGCKACSSKSLEDFDLYEDIFKSIGVDRDLIQLFSSLLAESKTKRGEVMGSITDLRKLFDKTVLREN